MENIGNELDCYRKAELKNEINKLVFDSINGSETSNLHINEVDKWSLYEHTRINGNSYTHYYKELSDIESNYVNELLNLVDSNVNYKMKKVKILNCEKTNFNDENKVYLIHYQNDEGNYGYYIEDILPTHSIEKLNYYYNKLDYIANYKMNMDKISISQLSVYLQTLIRYLELSHNYIFFVERDNEEYLEFVKNDNNFEDNLHKEIEKYNLEIESETLEEFDLSEFSDTLITVWAKVLEQVWFD